MKTSTLGPLTIWCHLCVQCSVSAAARPRWTARPPRQWNTPFLQWATSKGWSDSLDRGNRSWTSWRSRKNRDDLQRVKRSGIYLLTLKRAGESTVIQLFNKSEGQQTQNDMKCMFKAFYETLNHIIHKTDMDLSDIYLYSSSYCMDSTYIAQHMQPTYLFFCVCVCVWERKLLSSDFYLYFVSLMAVSPRLNNTLHSLLHWQMKARGKTTNETK